MSEIEKMYENAEVKPDHYRCEGCEYDYEDICPDDCPNSQAIYPPFTAEKQIELIKWLIVHSPSTCLEDEIIVCAFEDSLANIINTLWQELTEEEKQQVKGILEVE